MVTDPQKPKEKVRNRPRKAVTKVQDVCQSLLSLNYVHREERGVLMDRWSMMMMKQLSLIAIPPVPPHAPIKKHVEYI